MTRKFIYLKDCEFVSDDPSHRREKFLKLLTDGVKLMPILVLRIANKYTILDGVKRFAAHREHGAKIIEAFVCEREEVGTIHSYDNEAMPCEPDGQVEFPIVEYGEAEDQEMSSGMIHYLFKGPTMRIEYREAIHLHWGPIGRYRMMLGRRDFDILADAFENYGKNN